MIPLRRFKTISSAVKISQRCFSAELDFETAIAQLKTLKDEPNTEIKLKLYALYNQASIGDAPGKRPGVLDFVSRAKFDAWKSVTGIPVDTARKQYAELVASLFAKEKSNAAASSSIMNLKVGPDLKLSTEGRILLIELNRPKKYNALTFQMYRGITEALNLSNECDDLSVTVIRGSGNYFSSGNDLSNLANLKSPDEAENLAREAAVMFEEFTEAYIRHEKPLIILVNGPAVGIAVTTLGLADMVIASDKATFFTPFSSLGMCPEGCSSYTFPLLMGPLKSAEVLMFDRKLTAHEALERNLVNEVIPAESFLAESQKRVDAIAKLPAESLRVNKRLLRSPHLEAMLETNRREVTLLKQRWFSEDCMNSIQKFMRRK